jgi:DNA polymerase-3 subunit delta'
VIVLIAARAGALPATVRSRCQQLPFGVLADEEVAEVLRRNRWPAQAARQAAALAEGSPGAALARDGKSWQESADAVRAVLESLGSGDRGAALAFAEQHGEQRERTLLAIQSLLGLLRDAARGRLGAPAAPASGLPSALGRLGEEEIVRLLSAALETHRRLEGDRPPNAKLALATLLLGAGAGSAGAGATRASRNAGKGDRP